MRKNLPFNYPPKEIQPYFVDEVTHFTLNAYFYDPSTNMLKSKPIVSIRLVFKGDKFEQTIPTTADLIKKEGLWTLKNVFQQWEDTITQTSRVHRWFTLTKRTYFL